MDAFDAKKFITAGILSLGILSSFLGYSVLRTEHTIQTVHAQAQTLSSVDISTDSDLGNITGPVHLSALAKDEFGNPIFNGIEYEWTTSSQNSVVTVDANGAIATLIPHNIGTGYLIVIARRDGEFVDASRLIEVTGGLPACRADFNDDKLVDLSDYSILVQLFLTTDSTADANEDGLVDLSDYSILVSEFLRSCE